MVFLKIFFKKIDFEKNQQTTKKYEKFPMGQRVLKAVVSISMNRVEILPWVQITKMFSEKN